MNDTTVGIVMPTYNSEKYVECAIRSVICQDHSDWQLLVSDDGSQDRTYEIVREYMMQDHRIRWLQAPQGHTGVCGARARGIQAASTPWIAFLDSDDVWLPDKLSSQLLAARQAQAGFVFTASAFLDAKGRLLDYRLNAPERICCKELLKQNIISCSSVLIRRELLADCFQPLDAGLCEDFAAWIRVLRDRQPYAVGINRPLLQHRLSPGSLSSRKPRNALRVLKTYRACGLSRRESGWFWAHYAGRSLVKYGRIAQSKYLVRKWPYGLELSQ